MKGKGDLRRALVHLLPYRWKLAGVLALSLAGTGLALVLPYLSKLLVDEALIGGSVRALIWIVGLFMAVTLLTFALNVVSGLTYTRVSADVLFDMRLELYRHLQRLSPRFYAGRTLGDIVSRINNDVGEIQRISAEAVLGWMGHVLFLVGAVGLMVWLDWRLFLASVAVLPLAVVALVHYRRRLEGSVTTMRERSSEIGAFLIETLQGMRLVVSSNAQGREAARFRRRNEAFVTSLMDMQRLRYLAGGLPGLLLSVGTAVVFLYGGVRVIGGAITLGTFVAFMAYQMRLMTPVQGLMGLYAGLAAARVSLRRVHELLDTPVDVVERPDARSLPEVRGEIRLQGVGLSYGRGAPVLDDVTLTVAPGETLALVGASGSGKSTIADLLVRQVDPDAGRVLLDGHDLSDLRLEDLRRHVGVVEQEAFLFHAPLDENIRYARPNATEEEVTAALGAAGLAAFVAGLPEGAATPVGERGKALSGGERQRVALARALLADPAVLVLDEPTAFLDPRAEAEVVRGWERMMRGRTTILVTHRLEPARRAHRVVVLKAGRVVEEGPPEVLLSRPGPLRRLFSTPEDDGTPALGTLARGAAEALPQRVTSVSVIPEGVG
jgi:ATP-binding cassette, subfamily B, bacterial